MSAIPWLPALGLYLAILLVLVLTALLGGLLLAAIAHAVRPTPKRSTSEERHERRLKLIAGIDRKDYL